MGGSLKPGVEGLYCSCAFFGKGRVLRVHMCLFAVISYDSHGLPSILCPLSFGIARKGHASVAAGEARGFLPIN